MNMYWLHICNWNILELILSYNWCWNLVLYWCRWILRCQKFFSTKVIRLNLESRCFFNFDHGHLSLATLPLSCESPAWILTHPFLSFPICILLICDLWELNHSPSERRRDHLLWFNTWLSWELNDHDDSHLSWDLVKPLTGPPVSTILDKPIFGYLLCVCLVSEWLYGHFPDFAFHYVYNINL